MLDLDPTGMIVPSVDTLDQALGIVDAACFPPLGNRSFGGRRVIDLHGRGYANDANALPLVIAQIETPDGLEHLDDIAAVEGIDVLLFGPDDMKLRMGLPMDLQLHAPELASVAHRVVEACRKNLKAAMTVATALEALAFALDAGFLVVAVGGDAGLLKRASIETINMISAARSRSAHCQ